MIQNKSNKTVIGVTGGIGAGKSTVLEYIRKSCRCRVISADQVGKDLMQPGKSVYRALVSHYGEKILKEDGAIHTGILTEEAFRDADSTAVINSIEHPLIRNEICRKIRRSVMPLVFVEAALLKEGGLIPLCDEVWVVTASAETRIRRLSASRGYTREKAEAFIGRQLGDAEFEAIADRLIPNDGTPEEMMKEADRCLEAVGAVRKDAF